MTTSNFGRRLAELRKNRGFSQVKFAEKLKVSKSTVGMWETGDREPDNETLQKLADFFDFSIDYLLGRIDEPHIREDEPYDYTKDPSISAEEKEVLDILATLPEDQRKAFFDQARIILAGIKASNRSSDE